MLNLISNARDALGKRGKIVVRGRSVHHAGGQAEDEILPAAPGAYALLEVSDNGPGFDQETRRHVFEPFFTTKETGHGLGLAAVLGIVRAHGGGLRVISAPDAGATFQVLWPAAPSAPQAVVVAPASADGRTVLVIDDEDLVRNVIARMIEDLGYVALTASDGRTGLELIDRQSVDAVLVDMTMPRMTGSDVIAELRSKHPTLPVVLCSGYDRDRKGPANADAYLPKPFRIDALAQTLNKLVPLRNV